MSYEWASIKHLVAKFWVVLLVALVFAASANASGIGGSSGVGGMPGAPVFSGTVSSTKPCANGYTRVTPNFCRVGSLITAYVVTTGCVQNTALANVVDAVAVVWLVYIDVRSANAVGSRQIDWQTFAPTDAACGSPLSFMTGRAYEFVALASATINYTVGLFVAKSNASGQTYVQLGTACVSCTVSLRPYGYFD